MGAPLLFSFVKRELDHQTFLAEAQEMKSLCKEYNVPFVINDNVEIALSCMADGVHVGQSDMNVLDVRKLLGKDKIIGVSVQTVEEALIAQNNGGGLSGCWGDVLHIHKA